MATMTVDINSISLVDFLSRIGIFPIEKQCGEFLYLSPFRSEKKPSFSVNERKNCWYDFGLSDCQDYGLIGFIKKYYNTTEFIDCKRILCEVMDLPSQEIKCRSIERKTVLKLIGEEDIKDDSLIKYIKGRKVSLTTARRYLKQCVYRFYDKEMIGLSYKNFLGGTEIIAMDGMKCSLDHKTFTIFKGSDTVSIFEGIFDYLSFLKITNKRKSARTVIILNSVTSVKKAMEQINPLSIVHLYLDRDKAGYECRDLMFSNFSCTDHGYQYDGYKDLSDMLMDKRMEDINE